MTTVREIAEYAGVSKSTVSLVMNEKPGVSEKMRQQVMEAVRILERERTHAAGPGASALSIMVLHPPVLPSSYVFSEVLQGIQAAASEYNVQLRLVVNAREVSQQHVSQLYLSEDSLRPDGVLIFGAQQHEPLLVKIREHGIPCVVLGREAKQYAISGIERDEVYYARQAVRHLIDLGHTQIAFVGGEPVYDFTFNRLEGYQQALAAAGIAVIEPQICLGDGRTATQNVLKNMPDVTAMLFVNDSYAAAGLPVLAEHNLTIPDDISVVSFDDTNIAREHEPPLTSISYDRYEEGRWAVKALIEQIRYPYIERVQIVFRAELVVRGSTAAPIDEGG